MQVRRGEVCLLIGLQARERSAVLCYSDGDLPVYPVRTCLDVRTLDPSLIFQHVIVHLADDLILSGRAAKSIDELAIWVHQVEAERNY